MEKRNVGKIGWQPQKVTEKLFMQLFAQGNFKCYQNNQKQFRKPFLIFKMWGNYGALSAAAIDISNRSFIARQNKA